MAEFVLTGDVESIGMYGFYNTGLKEVVIPSTVKKVGNYAFASMDALESVTVSGSVGAGLGTAAFYENRNLKVLRFEEGVTVIPNAVCYPYSSLIGLRATRPIPLRWRSCICLPHW